MKNLIDILENHKLWLDGFAKGERANLRDANLCGANLCGANLCGADLCGANLCGANLCGARYDELTSFFAIQCPEEGSFIAYKKAQNNSVYVIVKLEITADAKRSSATSRKCRASKAKVLEITDISGNNKYKTAVSTHDNSFVYEVGETLEILDFDNDRWKECSTGIHFFINRQEAVNY